MSKYCSVLGEKVDGTHAEISTYSELMLPNSLPLEISSPHIYSLHFSCLLV